MRFVTLACLECSIFCLFFVLCVKTIRWLLNDTDAGQIATTGTLKCKCCLCVENRQSDTAPVVKSLGLRPVPQSRGGMAQIICVAPYYDT